MAWLPTGTMTGSPEPSYWTASPGPAGAPDRCRVSYGGMCRFQIVVPPAGSSSTTSRTRSPRLGFGQLPRGVPGRRRRLAARRHPDARGELGRGALHVAQCARRREHRVDLRRVVVAGHHERLRRSARQALVGERQPALQRGRSSAGRTSRARARSTRRISATSSARRDEAVGPLVAGDPDRARRPHAGSRGDAPAPSRSPASPRRDPPARIDRQQRLAGQVAADDQDVGAVERRRR